MRPSLAGALAGLTLLAAACGDDDDDAGDGGHRGAAGDHGGADRATDARRRRHDGDRPTTSSRGRPAAVARAHRLAVADRTPRSLFAIGAGDQVIAVDDQSNYPPEAAEP